MASTHAPDPPLARPQAEPLENRTPPVKLWALLGAAILAFIAWILIKWVTGPYFEPVENTASDPPAYMKVAMIFWQVGSIPAALFVLWRFVVRPWRRERQVGPDGILALAFATVWFQDPLSSFAEHYFVYNPWMVNYGSWTADLPWWASFSEPGAMSSEPILFVPAAYVYTWTIISLLGCALLRRLRRRWPSLSSGQLVAICFVIACAYDVLVEAILWLPQGVHEYPSGNFSIFGDSYHKYPLHEMLTMGAVWTSIVCLRYFTNDRGQMIVERGTEKLRLSPGKQTAVRALAATALVHMIMFVFYNVPNSMIAVNADPWPEDLQKRSYFLNNVCGDGTGRLCPGDGVSHHQDRSAYVDANGRAFIPEGSKFENRKIVPFDRGTPGGDK